MEFVISNHIKCHPLALLHPEKLSKEVRQEVRKHCAHNTHDAHVSTQELNVKHLNMYAVYTQRPAHTLRTNC